MQGEESKSETLNARVEPQSLPDEIDEIVGQSSAFYNAINTKVIENSV